MPDSIRARTACDLPAAGTRVLSGTMRRLAILLWASCFGLAGAHSAAASPLTLEEVIAAAGFDDRQQADLRAGKIVTRDYDEGSDKEMSILVALKTPISLDRARELWQEMKVLDADEDLLAMGRIDTDQAASEALAEVGFSAQEGDEIRRLLKVEPGSEFNLSEAEVGRFTALAKGLETSGCERDATCRSKVNEAYRGVLAERLAAYRKGGLKAIAAYARGRGKTANPAAELRMAADQMPLLQKHAAEIYRAWLDFPQGQPEGSQHRFLWLKRNVEGRPTFVLTHRALYETGGALFAAERHFYVGHFYNSLQMASYSTALGSESIHVLLNRTSSDLVAGFGSSAKKMVGRSKVRKALVGTYERLLPGLE